MGHPIPIIILGNKQDLVDQRVIDEETVRLIVDTLSQITQCCKGFRISYFSISLKNTVRTINILQFLAFAILEWKESIK